MQFEELVDSPTSTCYDRCMETTTLYDSGFQAGLDLVHAHEGYIIPGHVLRDAEAGHGDEWLSGFHTGIWAGEQTFAD